MAIVIIFWPQALPHYTHCRLFPTVFCICPFISLSGPCFILNLGYSSSHFAFSWCVQFPVQTIHHFYLSLSFFFFFNSEPCISFQLSSCVLKPSTGPWVEDLVPNVEVLTDGAFERWLDNDVLTSSMNWIGRFIILMSFIPPLGDGGTFRRWGLVGGSGSLEPCRGRVSCPWSLSYHVIASWPLPHALIATDILLYPRSMAMESAGYGLKPCVKINLFYF
jgi:hypothetical protein